jgi:putative ABC transport system permease protein
MMLKMLWRDARSGELNLLVAAMVLAVVIVTAISLFAERLQKSLVSEANVFLAADLVLRSPDPVNPEWLSDVRTHLLQQAQEVQFASMAYAGDEMALSSVKAVSDSYPLRGNLETSDQPFAAGTKVNSVPQPGEAWIDSRLLNALKVQLGDSVSVGEKAFVIKKILVREPDSGSSYWSLGPRILIALSDLPATKVIQPGSRVEYRYLFAGDSNALENYRLWLTPQLQKRHHLMTLHDSQPGLARSLERAEHFLLLMGSLGVMLACLAVAMAARRYSLRHLDAIAILKSLGATPSRLTQIVFGHLLVMLAVSIVTGLLLGSAMQGVFLLVMRDWLPASLPAASARPYLVGMLTAVVCTLVFALPVLWPLRQVPPLRVLRSALGNELQPVRGFYVLGVAAIFLLMWFYSNNLMLTVYVFGGTAVCAAAVALFAWGVLRATRRLGLHVPGMQARNAWRLGMANLQRHPAHSILQFVIFGLIFMLLLLAILVRSSIISEWQQQLPPGTPNQFLINIAPGQVEAVKSRLQEQHLQAAGFYPMVRGRVTAINGVEATTIISDSVDEVYRELNLTWSASLPDDNRLAEGTWWQAVAPASLPAVSIEKSLAAKLKVKVGDQLTFTIGDASFDAQITSLRELSWDRMRPNFYFIFEPGALDPYSATYITSFYLPKEQKNFLNRLLKEFPTLSIFEVDEMIARIQKITTQVTQAIELVLALVLLAGVLVLVACVQSSLDERIHESALLRALGASRKLILGGLATEFLLLGASAGLLAATGSEGVGWLLQVRVFQMEDHWHPWLWLSGPLAAMIIIGALGVGACRKVVRMPPWQVLRETAGGA